MRSPGCPLKTGSCRARLVARDEKVLLPRTLGEGDAERVDTSRGKDGAKAEAVGKE